MLRAHTHTCEHAVGAHYIPVCVYANQAYTHTHITLAYPKNKLIDIHVRVESRDFNKTYPIQKSHARIVDRCVLSISLNIYTSIPYIFISYDSCSILTFLVLSFSLLPFIIAPLKHDGRNSQPFRMKS